MSEAHAFEKAILEKPDEIAGYAAYADWLQEHDDPRGEFMQLQLALENEGLPKEEREKLKAREAELLKEHEREWLGELAPHLLDTENPVGEHRWQRGYLSNIDASDMSMRFAQAIASSSTCRLLREMRIQSAEGDREGDTARVVTPPGMPEHRVYFELIGAACLESLRVFRTGTDEDENDDPDQPDRIGWGDCHCNMIGIEHIIASMPRIEELHLLCKDYHLRAVFSLPNLTHLRVLRVYHIGERRYWVVPEGEYEYPLDALAANPALVNLTHLQFHPHWAEAGDGAGEDESFIPLDQVRALVRSPHLKSLTHLQLRLSDMGDDGVREIIASGILKRLKWLDLRHGCVTDEGAKLFAACPDAKNLERLDLSRNAVSAEGLKLLRNAKVNAVANRPLTPQELEQREYLREGDFE